MSTTEKPSTKTVEVKPAAAKPVARKPAAPKAAAKTTKPVAAKVAAPAKPAAKAATPKVEKPKKPKMVRDSFTMPKLEYAVIDALKLRAAKLERPVKKTELIRAGIKALAAMSDAALTQALAAVPSLKTGRPSGKKSR